MCFKSIKTLISEIGKSSSIVIELVTETIELVSVADVFSSLLHVETPVVN